MAWTTITTGRRAAGQLWTPELTRDLMARDWEVFTVPFDFAMTNQSVAPAGTVAFSLRFVFPESWGIDTTFESGMQMRLYVGFSMTHDPLDCGLSVVFDTNSVDTANCPPGSASRYDYAGRSYTTMPTGVTVESFTGTLTASSSAPGTESATIRRLWGIGSDCRVEVFY